MDASAVELKLKDTRQNDENTSKRDDFEQVHLQYDDILQIIGQFGIYQKFIACLICLVVIPCSWLLLSPVFTGAHVDHWCRVEGCDVDSQTDVCLANNLTSTSECQEAIWKYTAPADDPDTFDENERQCNRYYNISCANFQPGVNFTTTITSRCDDGWVYDTSQYKSSIVSEWDLVCGKGYLEPLSYSIYSVGVMVGAILCGAISDRFGRKPTVMLSIFGVLICGTIAAFSPNYPFYAVFRFALGLFGNAMFQSCFVLVSEFVGPDARTAVGFLIEYFFAFGYMMLPFMAYFMNEWRQLQLATSLPLAFFFIYIWVLPESPRWLISQNKLEEAEKIIKYIAKKNGNKPVPENLKKLMDPSHPTQKTSISDSLKEDKYGIKDLFRYKSLRRRTFVLLYVWFVINGVYYIISLNTSNLSGSDYANAFLSALVEIPAYSAAWLLVSRPYLGRRLVQSLSLILAGVACFLTPLPPESMNWLTITFAMIGKFGIAAAYGVIFIYTAELYPTPVRNVSVGLHNTSASIGSILAPVIVYLGQLWLAIPYWISAFFAITSALLVLTLPETIGLKMPETMEQGENLGAPKIKLSTKISIEDKCVQAEENSIGENPAFSMDKR